MDINYLLKREQVSLNNALVAASAPARIVHEKLAVAYGRLLREATTFPHRKPLPGKGMEPTDRARGRWEDDGGALRYIPPGALTPPAEPPQR